MGLSKTEGSEACALHISGRFFRRRPNIYGRRENVRARMCVTECETRACCSFVLSGVLSLCKWRNANGGGGVRERKFL